ncbi:MAG: hypothetical protein GY742_00125 [Hyphomicrobiales bacterium]|nr:hypothetical protein [Hyphomicrobiales bacterium]
MNEGNDGRGIGKLFKLDQIIRSMPPGIARKFTCGSNYRFSGWQARCRAI